MVYPGEFDRRFQGLVRHVIVVYPGGQACNSQVWIGEAPVIVVITGDIKRSEAKNGEQGTLFTHVEAGLIAQNLFLQVGALGLGAGIAGGMNDKALGQALKLPQAGVPFLVMPVGYKH